MAASIVQVVAHEDDDLLFLNPDLAQAIAAGVPVTTVYVTAGQQSGAGSSDGARARSRQLGVQAAYAQMAGAPSGGQWVASPLCVCGRVIERYTLAGCGVDTVFLNLPDGGLSALYTSGTAQTVLVDGSAVTTPYSYAHADVVSVLTALLEAYNPTLVRAQDPLPDFRRGQGEHTDHIAAAKFTAEAVVGYGGRAVLEHYRCYNIAVEAANLDASTAASKADWFATYCGYDPSASDNGWTQREYRRWPRGTSWMGRNADGRLQFFAVRGGTACTWWQTTSGSWAGPLALPSAGGALAAHLAVASNADGRIELLARRLTDHHFVHLWQTSPNSGFTNSWGDFGNPGTVTPEQAGCPAVAANGDGRLQMFVKNGGGGVSTVYQTVVNGGWSGWVDLGGTDVDDGLAAITNPAGCIEVVGGTTTGILHWYQGVPNQGFTLDTTFPAPAPASPPHALLASDGTAVVAYRTASGGVASTRQNAPASWWLPSAALPAQAGLGELAAVLVGGQVVLVGRKDDGHLAASAGFGSWTDIPGPALLDTPAAGVDNSGAIVLAGIGQDAVMYVTRQTGSSPLTFDAWTALP